MKIVFDIETNGLHNPDKIWVIVCKDIDTGEYHIFKEEQHEEFKVFSRQVSQWIGHNILGYDCPIVGKLIFGDNNWPADTTKCVDTLVLSKLIDYSRPSHSIEDYGIEFGLHKGKFNDWSKYSIEMEQYCIRDVDITQRVYDKYRKYILNPKHKSAILLEHRFQGTCNNLSNNGFYFNRDGATRLLSKVEAELAVLDKNILEAFPPRLKIIREIYPKETKYGTLNKTDFRWTTDLSDYNGGPFCRCSWVPFNPSSHGQIVDAMRLAGWKPTAKTKTHLDTEREYNRLKKRRGVDNEILVCYNKLQDLKVTGWKVSEENLSTLPPRAPLAARLLAKRILLESRRRTLTEWLGLVADDDRIHGKFYGIGAWTHRMAHQNPNTANISNEFDEQGKTKLLGKELRSLWRAPKNRLLVGVDAEAIQLRIFAHYIDEPDFTNAIVKGNKNDKTDPHSLNQRILGDVCKSRQAAKRFIFALLLGAGIGKLAEILATSTDEAEAALERLLQRYRGFARLKETTIPRDARRGWFEGIDGRSVRIPADTEGGRRHLCMSGYLQNGESIIIKTAAVIAEPKLVPLHSFFVDIVHDEFQTETPNDMMIATQVGKIIDDAIIEAGVLCDLKCPLKGSFWNDDHNDYTIGTNWYTTH